MQEDKVFLDTNILIYAVAEGSIKQKTSYELVKNGGYVSTQVLGEFINACLRKRLLSEKEAITFVYEFISVLEVCPVDMDIFQGALTIIQRYKFQWYDALIISAAIEQGCKMLYSEDLQHKQKIGPLTIINPFI